MKEDFLNHTSLEQFKAEFCKEIFLGPCDTFSIPPRNGCQALTVIEAETATPGTPAATPVGEVVVGMRRESGPVAGVARKLYKRHYAVWTN